MDSSNLPKPTIDQNTTPQAIGLTGNNQPPTKPTDNTNNSDHSAPLPKQETTPDLPSPSPTSTSQASPQPLSTADMTDSTVSQSLPAPNLVGSDPNDNQQISKSSDSLAGSSDTKPPINKEAASSSTEPVIKSRILENLKEISPEPFKDPQIDTATSAGLKEPTKSSVDTGVPLERINGNGNGQNGNHNLSTSSDQPPSSESSIASNNLIKQGGSSGSRLPPAKVEVSLFGKRWFQIVAGLVLLLILGFLGFNLWRRFFSSNETNQDSVGAPTSLVYWGLWEEKEIIMPLIEKYQDLHPNIQIAYQQQNHRQYRSRLQQAIRDGNGPDVFRFHNTWVPMLQNDLASAPNDVLSAQQLKQSFYPVMSSDLTKGNQVLGVPLMYDGLALVYNQAMLEAANAEPPTDWKSVRELAARLTVKSANRLERGGVAAGTADNVDHFSDLLGLLLLQNSANPADPSTLNAQTALEFYTLFTRSDRVWDGTMPQSVLAFANERVAMIFVPSWRLHEIKALNPNLRFGVAQLPQISDEPITWATYWAEGVNKKSAHSREAWEFINWLSQPEQLRQMYTQASKYRSFGELYPRVEMAEELKGDPIVAPYLEDALYAKSWYLASRTHDEGLNDQLIGYYKDAVNKMISNGQAEQALNDIIPGIKTVLSRFGVSAR